MQASIAEALTALETALHLLSASAPSPIREALLLIVRDAHARANEALSVTVTAQTVVIDDRRAKP